MSHDLVAVLRDAPFRRAVLAVRERGGDLKINVLRDKEEVGRFVVEYVHVGCVHNVEKFETD